MDIGLVGLGKMGGNMRTRLRDGGHTVVGYDRNADVTDVASLEELVEKLPSPKVVWVMVPAGDPTRETVKALGELLGEGDLVVDGGNSKYTDDAVNAELLEKQGVGFVDCGVSGGVWGLKNGYALMCGGSDENVAKVQPAFDTLKPEDGGFVHAGKKPGAGHFAKMVHNGIEYAMMQSYAEGWELLEKVDLIDNVTEVFDSWRSGTVIRSWLLDLLVAALEDDTHLDKISGYAEDSGEGRWTVEAAIDNAVPMHVIAASLFARFTSRQEESPAMKAIAAMRNQFGGHAVRTEPPVGGDANPTPDARAVYVSHLTLHDFRSYATADVALEPGVTAFIGRNGQGKTNLVEAIDYLSRLASHRVATDAPLVRAGTEQAIVRAAVVKDGRTAVLEIELNPGRSNRARINKSPLPKSRDLIGLVRTVVFSPEDLTLVKGDPSDRRKFLDDLLVLRTPRLAGVRSDYDRVLRQRNSLLKTAGHARRGSSSPEGALSTLGVWDAHLARTGAELLAARLDLVEQLRPYVGKAYETVARGASRDDAEIAYKPSFELPPVLDRSALTEALLAEVERRRDDELDRGISLVGPHRDELLLTLGHGPGESAPTDVGTTGLRLPVKGYASHGESWSFALALRLASYDLLRSDGDDPILILDDVFAELDTERRAQLAELVAGAEQVLVTAAVAADVPAALAGARFLVGNGEVHRDD